MNAPNKMPSVSPPQDEHANQKRRWLDRSIDVFIVTWLAIMLFIIFAPSQVEHLPYSTFLSHVGKQKVDNLVIGETRITGKLKDEKKKEFSTLRVDDPQLASKLAEHNIQFEAKLESNFWEHALSSLLWLVALMFLWGLLLNKTGGQIPGSGLLQIEKSRAKVYMESNLKTTFNDVAGVDEAKDELMEVVGFLKEPQRYNRLGGHLPKGILLVGPPGTGKTLLARAVAGEAHVPFFSISGSEFVEMFVGVGAARVRDLFAQAQKNAPCIIFIDELDALGRARSLNPNTGHDEKEQTLNQLLVELDGFDPRQGVVLLAASNRPEILDTALLRAGRFDRQILVDRPDKAGRIQILNVHMRKVVVNESVQVEDLAAMTPGFTGADLANLINEAVLLATRRNSPCVEMDDFSAALERIVAGLEKKNRLLNVQERLIVAHHEMGHALVATYLGGTDPVQKISIIPRGIGALGYTLQRPVEDRFLMSYEELENRLAVLLGGRAAETVIFKSISTGAADDLAKATEIAYAMVTRYGMNSDLGPATYDGEQSKMLSPFLNSSAPRRISEQTANQIDAAIKELVKNALQRAVSVLLEHRSQLEYGAQLLLSKETLTGKDLEEIRNYQPPMFPIKEIDSPCGLC